jgi:hypothetical protein
MMRIEKTDREFEKCRKKLIQSKEFEKPPKIPLSPMSE